LFGFPCDSTLTQCPDGNFLSGFFESADGNFYGIASEGGTEMNSQGTVFKLTKDGAFTDKVADCRGVAKALKAPMLDWLSGHARPARHSALASTPTFL
jgi:uncharacterized repeat protein (TIGR03803 family)